MHEARTSINPKSEIRNKFKFMEIKKRKEKRRQKDVGKKMKCRGGQKTPPLRPTDPDNFFSPERL
jgi:hypothetical protein